MHSLNDYMNDYLQCYQYRKRLDSKTVKAYRIDLNQFKKYSSTHSDFFSKNVIDSFITELHKQYMPKTVKQKIASLKAFFHYLIYKEILSENPFDKLDIAFREPKLLPKTIPFHIIQSFLNVLYTQKELAKSEYQLHSCIRDIAVIELLFATGMHISELCSLKPSDIDFENNTILIYGKETRERILQVGNPDVLSALLLYQETFREDIADIQQHITPHMFRHSFATLLLEQDVDIRYIQKILGHSSISTTEIYTHVTNMKQKEILFHKHPRNLMEVNKG